MVTRMVEETGIEHMLKSWIYLDNHDTPRLATTVPDLSARAAWPRCCSSRCPVRPTCTTAANWTCPAATTPRCARPCAGTWPRPTTPRCLDEAADRLHRDHRALRVGNYRPISSHRLLAFERYTDRVADTVLVIANPIRRPRSPRR
jgi:hypothetical protein